MELGGRLYCRVYVLYISFPFQFNPVLSKKKCVTKGEVARDRQKMTYVVLVNDIMYVLKSIYKDTRL